MADTIVAIRDTGRNSARARDVQSLATQVKVVGDRNAGDIPRIYDANTGITAGATQTQAGAIALTGEFNNITTCGTDGDGAKLVTAVAGYAIVVKNSGAASLAVYPATGDSINAMAVNLAVNIAPGGLLVFRSISDTVWETNEVVVLSAPSTQKGELIFKASDNAGDTVTTVTNASMAQASVITIPDPGGAAANVLLSSKDEASAEHAAGVIGTSGFGT